MVIAYPETPLVNTCKLWRDAHGQCNYGIYCFEIQGRPGLGPPYTYMVIHCAIFSITARECNYNIESTSTRTLDECT